MSIHLARKDSAFKLFNDSHFRKQWADLYNNCPWGTVFQDLDYLSIWYKNYKSTVELIFVYETDKAGNLIGLFPFTRCLKSGTISIAGNYHAEYQTWLATRENGNAFPENALDKLREEFPNGRLQIMFLAPNSPMKWLEGKWSKKIRVQKVPRPLVNLEGENSSEKSLKKKGNKSRIRQLKKRGELHYSRLDSAEEFSGIFDELEDNSRLRLSALHNVRCPVDENRKPFHRDLMRETNVLYPTLLKVGDDIASAQVCFQNKDEMLLCITSMSPFYAKQSPSKIHLLMLGQELAKTDNKKFDLSPGNGYKARFANETLDSYSLTIFFKKSDYLSHKARRNFVSFARKSLEKGNIKKNTLFKLADRLVHKARRVKLGTIPKTALKSIGRKIYDRKECRMYSFDVSKVENLKNPDLMTVDSISDLLKFRPVEGWQETTSQFHQKVLANFEAGVHSYSLSNNDKLLHNGWLIERQKISKVYEVDQEFKLPDNTAVLFDYYTHPDARGKGLYQKAILQGLHDAAKIEDTKQVFIGVMADNATSRHVIEKLGFSYEGSLFKETKLGRSRKWQDWHQGSQIRQINPLTEEAFAT